MVAKLLAILLALPWTKADKAAETPEARRERMIVIAESIAASANGDRLKAAFELVQFKHETDFDRAIQMCDCKRHQCDAVKTPDGIYFRAHSLSQAHEGGFRDLASWWTLCGVERANVDANVKFTARFYSASKLECGYARLAGIRIGCNDKSSMTRAAEARRISGRL